MTYERPEIERQPDGETFRSFYYLKEELVAFCRARNLPVSGGKVELTDRIAQYLDTGEVTGPVNKERPVVITEDSPIEPDFVCSELHRAFFREKIGKGFSFNVAFQRWLKENTGKTYRQAIEAYA